jgi:F-type H+-transporting ATPase subunit epsilon
MQLSLISPDGIIYSGDVEMIVVPGAKGDFGILHRHAPFMTMLRPGPITLYQDGQKAQVFNISGGFCEVTPENCVILIDSVQ